MPRSLNLLPKKNFNAIIEGTEYDDWRSLKFKITYIEVPENTGVINDNTYKYLFYGKTENFHDVKKEENRNSLETKVGSFAFCQGVPAILGRPRSLIMRDGRVFIDSDMMAREDYLKAIEDVLEDAKEFFESKEAAKVYKKSLKHPFSLRLVAPYAGNFRRD